MNKFLTRVDVKELKKYYPLIKGIPNKQHSQELDALIKWSAILQTIDELKLQPERVFDIGAGLSHLPVVIADKYPSIKTVFALDIKKIAKVCKAHHKVAWTTKDALEHLLILESKSFDLVYDACAITHFYPKETEKKHRQYNNLVKIASQINRILTDDGIFITVSDVQAKKRRIYPPDILRVEDFVGKLIKGGLKPLYDTNLQKDGKAYIYQNPKHIYAYNIVRLVFGKTL